MDKIFGNPLYRKGRPFLVINAFRHPTPLARTSVKGWQEKPEAEEIVEQVSMIDHISYKTLREAMVIIDVMQVKFTKYRYAEKPSPTEDEVVNYYLEKYKDQVAEGVTAWMRKRTSSDPATIQLQPA